MFSICKSNDVLYLKTCKEVNASSGGSYHYLGTAKYIGFVLDGR